MATVYEEGYYRGVITTWRLGKSKAKETPLIEFMVQIQEKKEGSKMVACDPIRERPVTMYFTENTIDNVVETLTSLGYDRDDFAALDVNHPNTFDFKGKECEVRCQHESFTNDSGKEIETEKFQFAMRGGGSQIKPIERKEVSELNARFGGKLKGGAILATPAPRPAQTATVIADADVI